LTTFKQQEEVKQKFNLCNKTNNITNTYTHTNNNTNTNELCDDSFKIATDKENKKQYEKKKQDELEAIEFYKVRYIEEINNLLLE